MAKKKKNQGSRSEEVLDIRHTSSTRINIPPAGLVGRGKILKENKIVYEFNPHLPPVLKSDVTGKEDKILKLINDAKERKLTDDEIQFLTLAYNNHQPWLEWSGKKEQLRCIVDPVALNIHERVSAQAVIAAARREDIQRDIFADPEMNYNKAIQFYKHPMGWTNRMILGDSLAVMASLSRREGLSGQVQMIYMDPPYGIKFSSNFMPDVFTRDVKDKDDDLSREVETVKAYRDTWRLGIHSYLSYLRERTRVCHELLSKSGSIFVQINAKNVHLIRYILDEIFGSENFICVLAFRTAMTKPTNLINDVFDFICWYSKDYSSLSFNPLYVERTSDEISTQQLESSAIQSIYEVEYKGKTYNPIKGWRVSQDGLLRLAQSGRIDDSGTLRYIRSYSDFPYKQLDNVWNEQLSEQNKKFVVQTNRNVINRCMLMTTYPGDIVLDPTCGSGTTAFVAEQWGRRWITVDISRISIAIARQRLLTATYPYYALKPTSANDVATNPAGTWLTDPQGNIDGSCTFDCRTAPHITLKSIAQNQALDPIFEKWKPIIRQKVEHVNNILIRLDKEVKKAAI